MDIYQIMMIIGILTYLSLILTALIGLRIIKVKFKMHKYLAIITLIFATIHGAFFAYQFFNN